MGSLKIEGAPWLKAKRPHDALDGLFCYSRLLGGAVVCHARCVVTSASLAKSKDGGSPTRQVPAVVEILSVSVF